MSDHVLADGRSEAPRAMVVGRHAPWRGLISAHVAAAESNPQSTSLLRAWPLPGPPFRSKASSASRFLRGARAEGEGEGQGQTQWP